jgi:hypothetical protein
MFLEVRKEETINVPISAVVSRSINLKAENDFLLPNYSNESEGIFLEL